MYRVSKTYFCVLINAFVKFKNLENIEYNNAQNFNAVFVC